jgi:mono/diheme cytochrome c family protein
MSWFALGALALAALPAMAQKTVLFEQGAKTYQARCALCHHANGGGQAGLAPPLTSYPARYASSQQGRRQLAMTVLYGMYGEIAVEGKKYNFKMPIFADADDAVLAEVLNHLVFDLAKAPDAVKPLSALEISAERKQTVSGDAVRTHRATVLQELGLP